MDAWTKRDPAPLEAAGLRWLADGGARVPQILSDTPEALVLQRVSAGRLDAAGEEDLGRMLATLHASGADAFGALPGDGDFLVGRLRVEISEQDDWPRFYRALCTPLAARIGLDLDACAFEAPAEPPARLHGDLWSGNVLADDHGRAWLIDPAAHGGHRETDLAMLALFGRIPPRTISAYDEAYPLEAGWRERIRLHQLFPLLVHAVLFGGSYVSQATDTARSLAR